MNILRAQRRRAQRPKERGGRKVTPVHAPPLSRRDADSQGSLHHGACAAGCGVWLLYPGRDNSGLHSALLLRAAARQRCPQHAAWQGHPASRDWSAWAQGCNRLGLQGHARSTLDGRTLPHSSPVVSHLLNPIADGASLAAGRDSGGRQCRRLPGSCRRDHDPAQRSGGGIV